MKTLVFKYNKLKFIKSIYFQLVITFSLCLIKNPPRKLRKRGGL